MLAANLTASFVNNVLKIEGTPQSDTIIIRTVSNNVAIDGVTIVNSANKATSVPLGNVSRIDLNALGGNDLIWIHDSITKPVMATGGPGIDLILAGTGTPLTKDSDPADRAASAAVTALWKRLETATRDASGTYTIGKWEVPSGVPGIPSVSLSNAKFKITPNSIELNTGTFQLSGVAGTVSLRGNIDREGKFTLTAAPSEKKVAGFTLTDFQATVTNDKVTYQGLVQHKLLGTKPISLSGNVNTSDGTYSLVGTVPPRTLFNGNLTLANQTVSFDKSGLKFTTDATLVKLGATVKFQGTLTSDGKYSLSAGYNGNLAGVSVKADKAFTWDSESGIKANFSGTNAGVPADSTGQTATFSFSGTYGPDNWSITGKYNKPIHLGYVTITDITATINKNKQNSNDFFEISCIGSFQGWKALANVKGTARFYRDGRYAFTADGSLIDTSKLSSEFGGYKVSGTTVVTTNMQVNQNSNGHYVINETLKTGTVSTVVHGYFKAGGFDLSRFSGLIDSTGFYKFQSMDKAPLPWSGVNIAKTTIFLEKGKGLTFSSHVDLGLYRFNVNGTLNSAGQLIITGSSGSVGGMELSNSSFRGEFNSNTTKYSITTNGTAKTPIGDASIGTKLDGTDAVPSPKITGTMSLSGAITKLFTGSVSVTMQSKQVAFEGKVSLKEVSAGTVSLKGVIKPDGTLTIGKVTVKVADLSKDDVVAMAKVLVGSGASLPNAFWSIANATGGFSKGGYVKAINGLIGAEKLSNDSNAVGNFLLNTVGRNLATTADTVYDWVSGNTSTKLGKAFWAVAEASGGFSKGGYVKAINGLINAELLSDSATEVGNFLLKTVGRNLATTASTLYDWVGGSDTTKLSKTFWSISDASGGFSKGGYVKAINGLIGAKKLANNSNDVGKFLLTTVGRNLATTADTVYDWVSGSGSTKLNHAFWAVANHKNFADGIRGLVNADLLGKDVTSIYNFLKSRLKTNDLVNTMRDLGFSVSQVGGSLSIPGLKISVSTSGGSIQIGGVGIKF